MPNAEHRNYARHVYANWKKNKKGDEFKRLFWRAVNATNAVDYIEALDGISAKNNEVAIHFVKKGSAKFCKSFFMYQCSKIPMLTHDVNLFNYQYASMQPI